MKCWKCKQELPDPPGGKLSFRELCDNCQSWLHCCQNCVHHVLGKPNECEIPGTEFISDREKYNYCEEFKLKSHAPDSEGPKKINPKDRFDALF